MVTSGTLLADFSTDRRVLWLSLMGVAIGVASAFVADGLLQLIGSVTNLAFFHRWSTTPASPAQHHLGAWVILVPVLGALIIGFMARFGSPKIRGHGIPEALEAILLGRSRIEAKVAALKPLSSAISIGTGGPFGAEGPIIMTGGALGSLFAQLFHLSANERKTLLVAGAAAGMAAVFATPLAATLLAVELLLFEWKPRSLIPVALAALVAAGTRVPLLGAGPIFPVPPHGPLPLSVWAPGLAIGMACGFGSCLLTALVYGFEDFFQRLPVHWMWWPALGALGVGLGALVDPRVLGVGYDVISALLTGRFWGGALVVFLLAKTLVWAFALASGTSGGVLAPLLMIGASLGVLLSSHVTAADPRLWALVGMVAMMAGTMRAPFTAVAFGLELTQDFQALPALMLAAFGALTVTVLIMKRSILTEKIARRGHHISREYSVDLFDLLRVRDVMDRQPPVVAATQTVAQAAEAIRRGDMLYCRRQALLLAEPSGRLIGVVTRGDLLRALEAGRSEMSLGALNPAAPVTAAPDDLLRDALTRMLITNVGRLPVVDEQGRAVGYLGRAEVLAARRKHHDEEHTREAGWLRAGLKSWPWAGREPASDNPGYTVCQK